MSCLLPIKHAWGIQRSSEWRESLWFLFAFIIDRTFVRLLEHLCDNCKFESSSYHYVKRRDSDTDRCINKGNKYQDALSLSHSVEQARQKEYNDSPKYPLLMVIKMDG